MKRKAVLRIITAMAAALALTGCADTDYERLLDRDDPVTVTVWHYYNGVQQTQFDEMVSEFNQTVGSEKGIFVEAYSKNSVNELADAVVASVNGDPGAETPPDIFGTYVETAFNIDRSGMLADLNAYFSEEEKAEYVDEYINEGVFGKESSLMIFPTAKSTEVMMLNLTDWQSFADARGVTFEDMSTWEGLAAVAEQYYDYTDALTPDVPNDGRAFYGRDSVANYMIVGAMQLGHPFAEEKENGEIVVSADKETVKRLWENFYVPYVKGCYASENRFRSDDAKIGRIIALIGSTTGAAYYPSEVTINDDYTYPIENAVLPIPNFEGCDPYIVQQGAGMAVIKSDEKTEYACTVFLKWFTEEQRNIRFSVKSGYLPVKKSANDFAKISGEEIGDTMKKTLKTAIDEINGYSLYTSPPFDRSADVRDFIGSTMEECAKSDYAEAQARISVGEERSAVLDDYISDEAFEKWYAVFESGLLDIVGQ